MVQKMHRFDEDCDLENKIWLKPDNMQKQKKKILWNFKLKMHCWHTFSKNPEKID